VIVVDANLGGEDLFRHRILVGLPWQTVSAFLRVITNRRLPGSRLTVEQATEIVEAWLEAAECTNHCRGDEHWSWLKQMMVEGQASGPLVSDAELAALTVEYGRRALYRGSGPSAVPGAALEKSALPKFPESLA